MKDQAPSPDETEHPMTFRGRGVSVNFTTPVLAGARVRQSLDRELEIVLPNPAGARGVYVLTWPAVRARCHVTLHDTVLFRQFGGLATIDPASIRDATLRVAREGLAGRDAAQAAEAALARDRAQRLLARMRLMTALAEPEDPDAAGCRWTPAQIEQRANLVLRQIAAALGRPAAELSAALIALGDLFAPIGITANDRDARLPRLLALLGQTAADPSDWLRSDPDPDISGLGETIRTAMLGAVQSGIAVLRNTRMALTDPTRLIRRRISDPDSVLAASARCDWLLDGWQRVSLLWLAANTAASRRATLLEAAPLVPVLPREVLQWVGAAIPPEAMTQPCRVTSQRDAWRTGSAAFRLIERNETLLAMSI